MIACAEIMLQLVVNYNKLFKKTFNVQIVSNSKKKLIQKKHGSLMYHAAQS